MYTKNSVSTLAKFMTFLRKPPSVFIRRLSSRTDIYYIFVEYVLQAISLDQLLFSEHFQEYFNVILRKC